MGAILLTGATGFVGQALLERLLRERPDRRVLLLLRPRGGVGATDRLTHLIRKPVFRTWRDELGDEAVRRVVDERLGVVEGDVATGVPDLPADIDVVIHCASTVSFDPPIDEAFQTNLLGTANLYEAVRRSGGRPHVVHVSTAYVAGTRKGVVPEASLTHEVDWRTELEHALAARRDVEHGSRRPEVLRAAIEESRVHAKSGPQTVAAGAEARRRELVDERLVDYGRTRARSLGWPDVYTFTKALGERAAEEMCADLPLSVVRPAIIESALAHPFPGWIDGFKMAEPIILAYGRGVLSEFPGTPDGIVDIVPVDLVANALMAVADAPPAPGEPAYYHVGSGARNPLTFKRLYELVREYFHADPLPEAGRGAVAVPDWEFPGMRRVEGMLRRGERVVAAADKALLRLPASERTQGWLSKNHKQQSKVEFLRRYADLYGVYVETEVIYTDDRLLALHRALPDADRGRLGFDTAVVDWADYLVRVHCPSVTAAMRYVRPPGGRSGSPTLPRDSEAVAVFDLEGTLLKSNVIEAYVWAALLDRPRAEWPAELASLLRSMPRYLGAERRDRGEFLRAFMRRYAGASQAEMQRVVEEKLGELMLCRAAPHALRRVREHQAAGHRTILITGTLELLIEPLRPLFDVVIASRLDVRDGRLSGFLERPPLVGEARAAWLNRYAGADGLDLARSWAYADSYSDRPLLEAVGNPVAVNPDNRLFRHAKQRHWPVQRWTEHVRSAGQTVLEAAR